MSLTQAEALNRRLDLIQKTVDNLYHNLKIIDPQINIINNSLTEIYSHIKQSTPTESMSDPKLSQQIWEIEKKLYEHCRYQCQDHELISVRFENLQKSLQGYTDMFHRFNTIQQNIMDVKAMSERQKQIFEQTTKEQNEKIKMHSDEITQLRMLSDKFINEQKYVDKLNRQIITTYSTVEYVDKLQLSMKEHFEQMLDNKINRLDFTSIVKNMEQNLELYYRQNFIRIEKDYKNKLDGLLENIVSRNEFDSLQKSFYMQKEYLNEIQQKSEKLIQSENKIMEEKLNRDINNHQGLIDQQIESIISQIKSQQERYKQQELQIMLTFENVQKNLNHLAQSQRKFVQNDYEPTPKNSNNKVQTSIPQPEQYVPPPPNIQFQIIQHPKEQLQLTNVKLNKQEIINELKKQFNENFFPISKGLQSIVVQNEQEQRIILMREEINQIQTDIYKHFKTNDKKFIDLETNFTLCLEKQNTVYQDQFQLIQNDLDRKVELPDINKIFDKKQFFQTLVDLKNQIYAIMEINNQQCQIAQQALRQQIQEKQKKISKLAPNNQKKLISLNDKINMKEFLLNCNVNFQQKLEQSGFKKSSKYLNEYSSSFIVKGSKEQQETFSQPKNILNLNKSILTNFPEEFKQEIKRKFSTERQRNSSECVRVKLLQKSQQVKINRRLVTSLENSPSGRTSPSVQTDYNKRIKKYIKDH